MCGNHAYIPNLDDYSIVEKRAVLALWVGDVKNLRDDQVERLFAVKVTKAVRELEEDITQTS